MTRRGIYFLDRSQRLILLDPATGQQAIIRSAYEQNIRYMAVAVDGSAALFVVDDATRSDIMMAEGAMFH